MRLFVFTVILLTSCENRVPDHPNYSLSGVQTGYKFEKDEAFGGIHSFSLKLYLTSSYDTLPGVYFMSCSWGNHTGITDDDRFHLGYHPCDANFLMLTKVMSTDTLEMETVVARRGGINAFDMQVIRVGIVLIDTTEMEWNDFSLLNGYQDKDTVRYFSKQPEHLLWSNHIYLKKMTAPLVNKGRVHMSRWNDD